MFHTRTAAWTDVSTNLVAPLALSAVLWLAAAPAAAQLIVRTSDPPAARTSVLATLRMPLEDLHFADAPLEGVFAQLGELLQLNVIVRWERLADMGIDRDTPVTLRARRLPAETALWLILSGVGGSDVRLAYQASDELLIISTAEDFDTQLVTRVYDVGDLLMTVPRFGNAPRLDATQALSGVGAAAAGSSGGGSPLTTTEDPEPNEPASAVGSPPIMLGLIEVITEAIDPDSWAINGGKGTIAAFRSQLVIRNTLRVHQLIAGHRR
ncbi:MAG: hypothetical protein AB7Q17_16625 [Phycisphaerae bacterium]